MQILGISLMIGFGVCTFASLAVWAFRIQRYVDFHGERGACVFFNSAPLRDYQTACRIAERTGRKPKFLIWFKRFYVTAMAFFIAEILALLIKNLK